MLPYDSETYIMDSNSILDAFVLEKRERGSVEGREEGLGRDV